MKYKYIITKNAMKDISKLNRVVQKRLKQKLEFYLDQDNPLSFAGPIKDRVDGDYRWRIGSWRVVFDVDGSNIVILRVQHRSEVYKK